MTLARWTRDHPTIRGLTIGHNSTIGGYTQYLMRVQGMPKETVTELKSISDDFIWAKEGEKKANTIAVFTLQDHRDKGGLKLLDLEARNESIDAVKIEVYNREPDKRPPWCSLADRQLAKAAVKSFKNIGEEFLLNPFQQKWRVNLSSKDLPEGLRRMMNTAYKYKTKIATTRLTQHLKRRMPIWYHVGLKDKLVSNQGDMWGKCQRESHHIKYVGEMLDHANKLGGYGCNRRINCKCAACTRDHADGCTHPTKCRSNAIRKLDNLRPEWDPRVWTEEETRAEPAIDEGYSLVEPACEPPTHPSKLVRIFTNSESAFVSPTHHGAPDPAIETADPGTVRVYTDGSCINNGSADARAGSGIWYGHEDERNTAIRLGPPMPLTNNTGELVAILSAIQKHTRTNHLYIASDSQYTIDAMTHHADKFLILAKPCGFTIRWSSI
ncbi:hypothetical protein D9611_014835 [Ephemerocybe angulata]|uniref:ribonuclease H n=1 Tax=Ephemerocybe angulata TaxID=980116 RepID=A0A8H5F9D7_9AGAR|nr:hypothetical protein D9611_014835 [Tulosesus angulatus]